MRGHLWPCGLQVWHLFTGTFVWVRAPHVAMLKTCPNMTLSIEQDITPTLTLKLVGITFLHGEPLTLLFQSKKIV